jgi:hypothetical protein
MRCSLTFSEFSINSVGKTRFAIFPTECSRARRTRRIPSLHSRSSPPRSTSTMNSARHRVCCSHYFALPSIPALVVTSSASIVVLPLSITSPRLHNNLIFLLRYLFLNIDRFIAPQYAWADPPRPGRSLSRLAPVFPAPFATTRRRCKQKNKMMISWSDPNRMAFCLTQLEPRHR